MDFDNRNTLGNFITAILSLSLNPYVQSDTLKLSFLEEEETVFSWAQTVGYWIKVFVHCFGSPKQSQSFISGYKKSQQETFSKEKKIEEPFGADFKVNLTLEVFYFILWVEFGVVIGRLAHRWPTRLDFEDYLLCLLYVIVLYCNLKSVCNWK